MPKRFAYVDDSIEIYGFESVAFQTSSAITVTFRNLTLNITGTGLYVSFFADEEAIIKGQIENLEVRHV